MTDSSDFASSSPLISAYDLAGLRAERAGVTLLDVRWRLDRPDGRDDYRDGHIPGAVYVDLDSELASHGDPVEGRHPLPAVEDLQAAARRWGVTSGRPVVVYDDLNGMSAARAWWLLTAAGVPDVRVLDGALRAWTDAGLLLQTGDETAAEPGDVTLRYGHLTVIDADGAAAFPSGGILVDARAPERFRGEVEPIDPRAGHIPGAVNVPATGNVDSDGLFLPAEVLRQRYADAGVRDSIPAAAYCGSGITAAHDILAMRVAGIDAALYPGSWSAWSNQPERPVATGG